MALRALPGCSPYPATWFDPGFGHLLGAVLLFGCCTSSVLIRETPLLGSSADEGSKPTVYPGCYTRVAGMHFHSERHWSLRYSCKMGHGNTTQPIPLFLM